MSMVASSNFIAHGNLVRGVSSSDYHAFYTLSFTAVSRANALLMIDLVFQFLMKKTFKTNSTYSQDYPIKRGFRLVHQRVPRVLGLVRG